MSYCKVKKMTKEDKLLAMRGFCEDNFYCAGDLVEYLNLSIEDIIDAFPRQVVVMYKQEYGKPDGEEET